MAAPTFAASGSAFSASGANVDVAAPAGVVAGSVVVLSMFLDGGTDQNVVPPAGWTAGEGSPVAASNHRLYVFWHRASGAEAGPYAFTWDASVYREGQAHRYEGVVAAGTPFDTPTSTAVDNASGTDTPAVEVTTAGADRLLLHAATAWSGGTWTVPTGFTKRQQPSVGLSTLSDKTQAVAGASGSVVATISAADKRTAWLGALKPAAANEVTGIGNAPLGGLAGTAVGLRAVLGTGAALLGGLTATATVAAGGGTVTTGSWYSLLDIIREARDLRATDRMAPPAACPNDGEPLQTGPDGGLFCRFDGWRPS